MTTPANPADLLAFVRAQLDDDERVAREADDDNTEFGTGPSSWADPYSEFHGRSSNPEFAHVLRHDPARVLAELEAKRRIMEIHNRRADVFPDAAGGTFDSCCDGCGYEGICDDPVTEDINSCPILRALALPYADREGFREEWRA